MKKLLTLALFLCLSTLSSAFAKEGLKVTFVDHQMTVLGPEGYPIEVAAKEEAEVRSYVASMVRTGELAEFSQFTNSSGNLVLCIRFEPKSEEEWDIHTFMGIGHASKQWSYFKATTVEKLRDQDSCK